MASVKRKRDSNLEDDRDSKRRHEELPRCYRRMRDIHEILMNGSRLDFGHLVGILHSIERKTDLITSLLIKDINSNKILICNLDSSEELELSLNQRVGKEIKLALTKPIRVALTDRKKNHYYNTLDFGPYCFILDGIRFEDLSGIDIPASPQQESPAVSRSHSPQPPQRSDLNLGHAGRSSSPYKRPKAWTSIADAITSPPNTVLTVAGVLKDISPLHQFNNGDFCAEYQIHDDSCSEGQFLEVKLYATAEKFLPPLDMSDVGGTVLLISKAKMTTGSRNSYIHARGNKFAYRYCCFSKASDGLFVHPAGGASHEEHQNLPIYRANEEEKEGMRRLLHWANGDLKRQTPKSLAKRDLSHWLVKDIRISLFFDGTFELLHVDSDKWNTYMYVTDYTHNPRLQEPGASSWWYPEGNRTLKLKLFDSLGEDARALRIGSVCRVKYIRVKSENGSLVGYCGAPSGVILRVHEGDVYYQNLKARKRGLKIEDREILSNDDDNYNMTLTQNRNSTPPRHSSIPARNNMKSSPDPETSEASDVVPLPTTAGSSSGHVTAHSGTFEHPAPVPKVYPPFPSFAGEIEHSDLIECVDPNNHDLLTLHEISSIPYCPTIFRFRARIVDVNPCNLNQAIVAYCEICETPCNGFSDGKCGTCHSSSGIEYRVRLELVLQDSSGELPMRVDDKNAARFFRLPQRPNRDRRLLTQKLLRRFDLLMGTTSTEGEEIVGGVSEIFELKGRNWQIRKEEGTILSQARWRRQHALTACRIRADSKDA